MLCCFAAASVLPGVMATEDFQFTFKTQGLTSTLSVPLRLPLNQPVEELSECLMKEHNLPCFVEKGIVVRVNFTSTVIPVFSGHLCIVEIVTVQ